MSNRTDFGLLVRELEALIGYQTPEVRERLETEFHNAYVAGQEGNGCLCRWCAKHDGLCEHGRWAERCLSCANANVTVKP